MTSFVWDSRPRNYEEERCKCQLPRRIPSSHPLKAGYHVETKVDGKLSSVPLDPLDGQDPLSQFMVAGDDPLSKIASTENEVMVSPKKTDTTEEDFEPWTSRRSSILVKFTTSEKLSIVTSFLSGGEKIVGGGTTVSDKVRNRLEQLDEIEEGAVRQFQNLTQQEYTHQIQALGVQLKDAWGQDQRVKALKIAIQCSKLLGDTGPLHFYPSKFVLITDLLDNFGTLVHQRLRVKCQESKPRFPENFTEAEVPYAAKETCKNWFFKIASIRELLPRFYVETAILKAYNFITTGKFPMILDRLTKLIAGIGDPLVAAYARCYLTRVAFNVAPLYTKCFRQNFDDFLLTSTQLNCCSSKENHDVGNFLVVFPPALDWITQCAARSAKMELLGEILGKLENYKHCMALVIYSCLNSFPPLHVAAYATQIADMLHKCEFAGFPEYLLYRSLGLSLLVSEPPPESRLTILNTVWKSVTKFPSSAHYMACAEIWAEYTVKHFSTREVNTLLGDVIKHMSPDRQFELHYQQLHVMMARLVSNIHNFAMLFSMDNFLPFLNLFAKESAKVDVCKLILEGFIKSGEECNDTNVMMTVSRALHDAMSAMSPEDEKRQVAQLVASWIRRVRFGRDVEDQLAFYVDCRANFCNLELVLITLVQLVNNLMVTTQRLAGGRHSRKSGAFVRACAAYCFITIPSITSVPCRLQLYLLSSQVALQNHCFGQAEASFRAAMYLLPECSATLEIEGKQKSSETFLVAFTGSLMSSLLVFPDPPEEKPLQLVHVLINALGHCSWEGDCRYLLFVKLLSLVCALSQDRFLFHVSGVDSNDSLYCGDEAYKNEVNILGTKLLEDILLHLKELGEQNQYRRQAFLALELFSELARHGNIEDSSMAVLLVNLWNLSQRHAHLETDLLKRELSSLKKKQNDALQQILPRLTIKQS